MKLLVLDNEGVQSLNDNAQENTVALAKVCGLSEQVGVDFYRRLSNIDDIWGDFHRVPQDPTYSSGHTLKVILPFLKAMGANYQWMQDFTLQSLRLMPNIHKVLPNLVRKYNVWMISTSYEFFIRAFCQAVRFDFTRVDCTFVERFDEILISGEEQQLLLAFMREVAQMLVIEYDGKTGEVKPEHQEYYERFTDFIWNTVYNLPVGEFLRAVHPVGQAQKREAVERKIQELQIPIEEVMGVGDSQTDVQWVELLGEKGLSLMFNGKGKVCHRAGLMYIGDDAQVIERVADLFAEKGRQAVIDYYTPGRTESGGFVAAVTPENIGELEPKSVEKREQVRGVHIGELT